MRIIILVSLSTALGFGVMPASGQEKGEKKGGCCRNAEFYERILKRFDTDGDGKLSETERAAAKAACKEHTGEFREKLKERFDTNGDGTLSEEERTLAKAAMQERKDGCCDGKKFMGKFDTDGDGKLSDSEREAAKEEYRKKHPKGNNGVGNGEDPQPPGNPKVNDGAGTGPGNPGARGGKRKSF